MRAKGLSLRDYRILAEQVQEAVRSAGGLFIVNDHVAVAAAIRADGVHVGQDDLPVADVRQVIGPMGLIGLSAHTPEQAHRAIAEGADYLGLGPMYATTTKPHEPQRGPELLRALGANLPFPSYAIGGLTPERIQDIGEWLPHGVAVAGYVCGAESPTAAAADIAKAINAVKKLT